MKIVHAADLHLDSPLRGLERYEGAPVERIRGATRRALENLVDLCLTEAADLLLIAGDLYDGNWKDYATGLFFSKQMSRLRHADIPVVLVRGNHDAASQITKNLQLPENVIELATRKPQTHVLEAIGVAVHGQGFATRAVIDDLAQRYPEPIRDLFNVGLLHTCVDGRPGHDTYAPCALSTLIAKGYDYWALGHVHQREVLSRDPWVVFPGNLQGRHAQETGPKGASLVSVHDGRVVDVVHRPLDVVRWLVCEIDVSSAASPDDIIDLVRERFEALVADAEGRTLAVRVVLGGSTSAHDAFAVERERWEQELRGVANDTAGDGLWIEQLRCFTQPLLDRAALLQRDDAIGHVARALRALVDDPGAGEALVNEFAELRVRLPPDARADVGPDAVREALADIERTLMPRLLAERRGT